jgi:hypothetical protein
MAQRVHLSAIAPTTSCMLSLAAAALVALASPSIARPVASMSCFTIAGEVTCFEAGGPPAPPVAPIMAPMGPIFGGEDEEIVMRDDGGHVVERG